MGLKKLKFISSKNNLVMEEYKFYCFSYINYIFLMHLDLSLGDFGNKNIKITTFKKKKKNCSTWCAHLTLKVASGASVG